VISQWYGFFTAEVGATAALAGLLFVALSVNISRIMQFSWLPSRAALTLVVLVGALLESSLALFPPALARFELIASAAVAAGVYLFAWRLSDLVQKVPPEWKGHPRYRRSRLVNLSAVQLATIPPVVGAAILLTGGNGYPWLAIGVLFSLVYGILNSWVLLVEILR
jgi:hypothetical protein